ncbi:MAG: flagellar basal-body rod protein FlgG [Verrucomicrobiae bacterium]
MIPSLHSSATGMEAQQLNLNTIANNLANVSTMGFKKSKIEFSDLLYQRQKEMGTDGGGGNIVPVGTEIGNGSRIVSTSKVYSQGQLTQTGEKLDFAIEGEGFFEVERPDGTKAYTRDGGFKLSTDGLLLTKDAHKVNFPALDPTATAVSVAATGEVTQTVAGVSTLVGKVELARFANPAGLRSIGGNLVEETPASGTVTLGNPGDAGFGKVNQGYLETSNVNVAEEMVNMILAQRAYEINSKAIQTSDKMLEQINQIKR